MAETTKSEKITWKNWMASTLAMTDALAKLMTAKGIITKQGVQNLIERAAGELPRCAEADALERAIATTYEATPCNLWTVSDLLSYRTNKISSRGRALYRPPGQV